MQLSHDSSRFVHSIWTLFPSAPCAYQAGIVCCGCAFFCLLSQEAFAIVTISLYWDFTSLLLDRIKLSCLPDPEPKWQFQSAFLVLPCSLSNPATCPSSTMILAAKCRCFDGEVITLSWLWGEITTAIVLMLLNVYVWRGPTTESESYCPSLLPVTATLTLPSDTENYEWSLLPVNTENLHGNTSSLHDQRGTVH